MKQAPQQTSRQTPQQKDRQKPSKQASSASTNIILVVFTFIVATLGSLYWLEADLSVQGQKYWLISRAAAISAYIVMSIVVLIGIVLSHPRNKDTWRLTPYLLPWHQAFMAAMFALIGLHIFFTVADSKSGITWSQMWFPIQSKYHPFAMVLGAFGVYALLLTTVTAALRKRIRLWIFIHRLSWLSWVLVFFHGIIGGTDTQLRPLFWWSGLLLFAVFSWRHWTTRRYKNRPAQPLAKVEELKTVRG